MRTKKKSAGMSLRRPKTRTRPKEKDVKALVAKAEGVASKVPGSDPGSEARTRKAQITAYLPAEVRDELRKAAVALSGPPHFETVTSLVERAIRRELKLLRRKHGDFDDTVGSPRPGRRTGR